MKKHNPVKALSHSFLSLLYDEWHGMSKENSVSDFISLIKNKYSESGGIKYAPGETGVYYNESVFNKINQKRDSEVSKNIYDYDCAKLLFHGDDSGPGLYRIDEFDNKVPLTTLSATDHRIWDNISLFLLGDYTINRWGSSADIRRLFLKSLSRVHVSRHSAARLYWSGLLCHSNEPESDVDYLKYLLYSEDFLTQVTERNISANKMILKWFLEFCHKDEIRSIMFSGKGSGDLKYRVLLKLLIADNQLYSFGNMSYDDFQVILRSNFEMCKAL